MHLIIISTVLMVLSISVSSKEISVEYDFLKYKLSYTKDLVTYSGQHVDLTLKQAPCNEHLLVKFNHLMDKMLSQEMSTSKNSDSFKITINNKDFYESKKTVRAVFFKEFDRMFKQIKTEEFVNCEVK